MRPIARVLTIRRFYTQFHSDVLFTKIMCTALAMAASIAPRSQTKSTSSADYALEIQKIIFPCRLHFRRGAGLGRPAFFMSIYGTLRIVCT